MGEFVDKVKGNTNEAVGKARQAVGDAVDSKEMQAKGLKQEAKGEAQKAAGTVKGALRDDICSFPAFARTGGRPAGRPFCVSRAHANPTPLRRPRSVVQRR